MDNIQVDLQQELNSIESKVQVIRTAYLVNVADNYIVNCYNQPDIQSNEPVCQFFGHSSFVNKEIFAKLFENSVKLFTIVETLVNDDIEKVYDPEFYNEMVITINNILKD